MLSFQSYGDKLSIPSASAPEDERVLGPRLGGWDAFSDQFGVMPPDQKPLFVDPGLYKGESENDEMKTQIQVLSMEMSRPSTRRTSSSKSASRRTSKSGSATTDITPPSQEPPKKKKARKTRKEPVVEEEHKRSKFLERNRIAASKCREKKKQYVSDLEETKIGLETQHAQLQMEYNGLLGEVSGLKHHLMAHAKCNDPNIDRWLNIEARRFVQTTNGLFGQTFAQYNQGGQAAGGSPDSRNASIASTYQALQGVQFETLGPGERQGSMSYSHGSPMYASPTEAAFPCLSSPHPKREPDINYNHMPDNLFSPGPEPATFGAG